MDAKTLEALNASIAKWERNAVAETSNAYLISKYDCPLCALFYNDFCEGCPVFERTGETRCDATPYVQAVERRRKWIDTGDKRHVYATHTAARKEAAFLKSLLPASEPS